MGCGTKTIKISTVAFNIIFAILGILVLLGAALSSTEEIEQPKKTTCYILGAVIILFAILGCLAALRESLNLAIACTFFFLALAITQLVLVCIDRNKQDPHEGLNTVNAAFENASKMDELQIKYECCGKSSAQDYVHIEKDIPISCYSSKDSSKAENLFMSGCSAKVQEEHETSDTQEVIVQWVLIAFELIGFFLHLYLLVNFRNKQRRLQF